MNETNTPSLTTKATRESQFPSSHAVTDFEVALRDLLNLNSAQLQLFDVYTRNVNSETREVQSTMVNHLRVIMNNLEQHMKNCEKVMMASPEEYSQATFLLKARKDVTKGFNQ
jgi:hypothetical protein